MACYIYKHPDVSAKIYKVGKSNDVVKRHATLSTAYFRRIIDKYYIYPVMHTNYTSGMLMFIEHTIHLLFKKFRIRKDREFFKFDQIDKFLQQILDHFAYLNIPVKLTKNLEDLQTVKVDHRLDSDDTIITDNTPQTIYKPKFHQIDILVNLHNWYASDEKSGKLILPPGIGKSYISGFHIKNLNLSKVLVLVPLKIIAEDFSKALQLCGCQNVFYQDEIKNLPNRITVLVYNTARNNIQQLLTYDYDLIIYDEAHHMCAEENSKLLKIPSSKKLYLTATERVITDSDNDNEVFDMNHPDFGILIHQMTVLQAIEKSLLCDYKIFLADWLQGLESMAKQLKNDYHRKKIIIFHNSINNSKQATELLNAAGYPTSHIDGNTPTNIRKQLIDDFTNADFHIICNVGVIGEGANIPCIDTVIFADDRTSQIGVIQNIGRGLRIHNNKDFCIIIVSEKMIKEKFLVNLLTYDQRLIKAKHMIIGPHTKSPNPYSIDGIVNIIEKYTSKQQSSLDNFIRKLKDAEIYSEKDYREKITYSDEFPMWPVLDYPGFKWSSLLEEQKESYTTKSEIQQAISNILFDPAVRNHIKKLNSNFDRLGYLRSIDPKIPAEILTVCQVSSLSLLNPNVFISVRKRSTNIKPC